jgi:hypothetical protein
MKGKSVFVFFVICLGSVMLMLLFSPRSVKGADEPGYPPPFPTENVCIDPAYPTYMSHCLNDDRFLPLIWR